MVFVILGILLLAGCGDTTQTDQIERMGQANLIGRVLTPSNHVEGNEIHCVDNVCVSPDSISGQTWFESRAARRNARSERQRRQHEKDLYQTPSHVVDAASDWVQVHQQGGSADLVRVAIKLREVSPFIKKARNPLTLQAKITRRKRSLQAIQGAATSRVNELGGTVERTLWLTNMILADVPANKLVPLLASPNVVALYPTTGPAGALVDYSGWSVSAFLDGFFIVHAA